MCVVGQDRNGRGEERSLASDCGERLLHHEARGEGQGAECVQRREFISSPDTLIITTQKHPSSVRSSM